MSSWNPTSSATDGWNEAPSRYSTSTNKDPIPDDWDTAEDLNQSRGPPDPSKKLWEDANARPPPAQVVLSSGSASIGQTQLSQLNNLPRTILKRPTNTTQTSSNSSVATASKTLEEREASYQAARERIFGGGPDSTQGGSSQTESSLSSPGKQGIIRPPRGPPAPVGEASEAASVASGAGSTPKSGFAGRVRRQGHGRTISDLEGIADAVSKASGATAT